MSLALHGMGVSRGTALGKARILKYAKPKWRELSITRAQVPKELKRLEKAIEKAKQSLRDLREQIPDEFREHLSEIIDTHTLMLADNLIIAEPKQLIETRLCNAEWAVQLRCEQLTKIFEEMDDPYLRGRKEDVVHVLGRVSMALAGSHNFTNDINAERLRGSIVIIEDSTAEDAVLFHRFGAIALVTEHGSRNSHAAVVARSMRMPTIVRLRNASRCIFENEQVIVDGNHGVLLADPDKSTIQYYKKLIRKNKRQRAVMTRLRNQPTCTQDGVAITLQANVELPEDFVEVRKTSADGVGLYRTEFLYMNRENWPDEEEHYTVYRAALNDLDGLPLCIRTVDFGADSVRGNRMPMAATNQANPAMGLRGIRLGLRESALFLPQLRAILRASAHGKVRLLLPMLSSIEEVQQIRVILRQLHREFSQAQIEYDTKMPVGGMIEVPAAAIRADSFAQQLDFLAIGTNDLTQYTLAADPMNDDLGYLGDTLHPAVLSLIHIVLAAGHKARIPVTLCGEMASELDYTRLLIIMGLRKLSVQIGSLLAIRQHLNHCNIEALSHYKAHIEQARTSEELTQLVQEINAS